MNVEQQLSERLGKELLKRNWSITTAESCTGGGISKAITEVAGSSSYFNCAFVTYSNASKQQMVGVSEQVIREYGAVSEQTVVAMASGALTAAQANVAIAVSGIAGPGGGTESKPVGTVWLAIVIKDSINVEKTTVWSQCFNFAGDRKEVRDKSVEQALIKALEIVQQEK